MLAPPVKKPAAKKKPKKDVDEAYELIQNDGNHITINLKKEEKQAEVDRDPNQNPRKREKKAQDKGMAN